MKDSSFLYLKDLYLSKIGKSRLELSVLLIISIFSNEVKLISLCVKVKDGINLKFKFFKIFKSHIIPTLKPGDEIAEIFFKDGFCW